MNILLVEDNLLDQQLVKTTLKRFHTLEYELTVSCNGKEAFQYLMPYEHHRKKRPLPELMIIDIHMPEMNGLELLQKMDRYSQFKPIYKVVMTTSQNQSDKNFSFQYGANDFVTKPAATEAYYRLFDALLKKWSTVP